MQLLENKLFLNFQDDSLYEVDCPSETNITVKYNAEVLTDDEQLVTTSVTTTSTVPATTGKSVFYLKSGLNSETTVKMATNITTTIATTTTKLVKEIAKTVKVRTVDYMVGVN